MLERGLGGLAEGGPAQRGRARARAEAAAGRLRPVRLGLLRAVELAPPGALVVEGP